MRRVRTTSHARLPVGVVEQEDGAGDGTVSPRGQESPQLTGAGRWPPRVPDLAGPRTGGFTAASGANTIEMDNSRVAPGVRHGSRGATCPAAPTDRPSRRGGWKPGIRLKSSEARDGSSRRQPGRTPA